MLLLLLQRLGGDAALVLLLLPLLERCTAAALLPAMMLLLLMMMLCCCAGSQHGLAREQSPWSAFINLSAAVTAVKWPRHSPHAQPLSRPLCSPKHPLACSRCGAG